MAAAVAGGDRKNKARGASYKLAWQRAGTGRAKELQGTAPAGQAVGQSEPTGGRPLRPSEASRPLALHTQTYTYVFSRLQHHAHRTQLQRTFCEGLHGAPPAEPNAAFYSELDERLRLQHTTLAAVHTKSVEESLAAAGWQAAEAGGAEAVPGSGPVVGADTVSMRNAVNSSLSQQLEFFTACMAEYCGEACACSCPGCECSCRTSQRALRGLLAAYGR
ncbi:hypothetical protein TSOC_009280 [Tetrabaena socialis]|uniref:Uncharacterized protein n=1 Tax=Tetrabaena socialis TaxID=47790 RepID=A0A2J7ZWC6_9CHLO|nr:hypothetical protein TSOC_009280 [Tetrabaena socialis]|eukprot:PNH04555.1 hypothetical protein TSOC_009280 [Tetrabaena socialis]